MEGACSSRVFLALDTAKRSFGQSPHAAFDGLIRLTAVEALADARGWLCWPTGAFHAPTRPTLPQRGLPHARRGAARIISPTSWSRLAHKSSTGVVAPRMPFGGYQLLSDPQSAA
jgi:hypothetical protein